MPDTARLLAHIENAASVLTPYWPLKSFIAANPLQGLEDQPFEDAVAAGARLFGGVGWPDRATVARAYAEGRIDPDILAEVAAAHGRTGPVQPPVAAVEEALPGAPARSEVNRVAIKWLSAFLDEGQAAWPMPHRDKGLWRAFRLVAVHDPEIPDAGAIADLPESATETLLQLLHGVAEADREGVLTAHLASLPGWAGYVKWRAAEQGHPWRRAAPARLADLLAVRMVLARQFDEPTPEPTVRETWADAAIWLEAWEETWRRGLTERLDAAADAPAPATAPEAQLVFCIDVRSEVLRRHVEASGPYETLGFAGFFGVPVAIRPYGAEEGYASCPVLLQPKHTVPEAPVPGAEATGRKHLDGKARLGGLKGLVRTLKESVAGCFAFVEASGAVFGAAMIGRTLAPGGFKQALASAKAALVPDLAVAPKVDLAGSDQDHNHDHGGPAGLSLAEQADFAESSLRIMGLTAGFAPLVVLTGHGGETVNNPFEAGLDCGACGGNRGAPNARVMAAILNAPAVRERLAGRGIVIPEETLVLAAEHNTTTDTVTIFDPPGGIGGHAQRLAKLRGDLASARKGAAAERITRLPGGGDPTDPVAAVERRAADWAQVRPEWALARNAGFIVGPRTLTRAADLDGRCFLHSYDWTADDEGRFLEVILTAPMVVAEWINTQYFFSTVDNAVYGAGSKTTHNVVGAFGVVQGNGSDLMTGLPAQSVMAADGQAYHEPLRLMTVVEAPVARLDAVIARNGILQTLFGNGWVALMVIDPETGRKLRRSRSGAWLPVETPWSTDRPSPAIGETAAEAPAEAGAGRVPELVSANLEMEEVGR